MLGYGCDGQLTPEEAVRQVVMLNASKGVDLPAGLVDELLRVARREISADELTAKLRRLYGEETESEAT